MPDPLQRKICFVVGPIGSENSETRVHADWLLNGIVKPVLADFPDFDVKRADEDKRPGLIDVQMINDLLNAELVIADLSFHNPNAFYEIGIRHMAEKPIIHMQLATENPPFDVSQFREIKFSRLRHSDVEQAKGELRHAIEAVLAEGYQVTNPVTNARGHLKLEETASPEIRVLMDEMDSIKARLDSLQLYIKTLVLPADYPGYASAVLAQTGRTEYFGPSAGLGIRAALGGLGMVPPGAGLGGISAKPSSS